MMRKRIGRKSSYLGRMTATGSAPSGRRIVPLEAVRGIAAVAVVIYHSLLSFAPNAFPDAFRDASPAQLARDFVLGLANGGAAVTLFFVLSGFVLSLPFAPARQMAQAALVRKIGIAVLKRWPRLAGLTVLGCLSAWLLFRLSGNTYAVAAHISGSDWLKSHANSPISPLHPLTAPGAFLDGLIRVFASGDVRFNSALWTMRIELFCSLVIFFLAPALFALRRWWMRIAVLAAAIFAVGADYPFTYLTDFLCGITLALLATEARLPAVNRFGAALLFLIVLFSFGFSGEPDLRLYAPLRAILPAGDANHFVWEIGAVALMIAVLGHAPLYRMLSRPWAAWLGVLSFPLYVIHVPILLSLGAASFIHATGLLGREAGIAVAMAVTLAASVGCAMPLAWIDRHWCGVVNTMGRQVARSEVWKDAALLGRKGVGPGKRFFFGKKKQKTFFG